MSGSGGRGDFTVRHLADSDGPAVLALLNEAFDRSQSSDWYEWKHRSGPWGPSVGWVAEDDAGIVAARLMTPWALRGEEGLVPIERAMDGAVSTRARRQGLFSRCVVAEMDEISAGRREANLVYSTSVPASREAYRKLGWEIRDIPHVLTMSRPTLRGRGALVWDDALDHADGAPVPLGATAWTPAALRWRIDSRSGHEYRTVRLREGNTAHGLILRKAHLKRVPVLVVVHAWGGQRELRVLLPSAAAALRTPLQLQAGTPLVGGVSRAVGASTVSAWSPDIARGGTAPRMSFEFADLEGVM